MGVSGLYALVVAVAAAVERQRHQSATDHDGEEDTKAKRNPAVDAHLRVSALPCAHHERDGKRQEPQQGCSRDQHWQVTTHTQGERFGRIKVLQPLRSALSGPGKFLQSAARSEDGPESPGSVASPREPVDDDLSTETEENTAMKTILSALIALSALASIAAPAAAMDTKKFWDQLDRTGYAMDARTFFDEKDRSGS